MKDFLSTAIKKKFPGLSADELKFFEDEIVGFQAMLGSLTKANITSTAVHRNDAVTDGIYNDNRVATFNRVSGATSLNVGTKYFYDIGHNQIRANNDSRYYLTKRSEKDRVYTLVHEAIHSISPLFSDEFFAEYLTNGKIKETDEKAKGEGSRRLTEKIKELCP